MQGNQLRRDLNVIVGSGKNWSIPSFWGPLVKYISGPALAIVYSFSYPAFYAEGRFDPLHIFGFAVAHIALILIFGGMFVPRWFNILIPTHRRGEGKFDYAPCVLHNTLDAEIANNMESATADRNGAPLAGPEGDVTSEPVAEKKNSAPKSDSLTSDGSPPDYGNEKSTGPREEPLIR